MSYKSIIHGCCLVYLLKPNNKFNGHEYVDLGLPSGTKWAKMNVGAQTETDYGLYFAWGDTQGYTASQVGNGEGQKAFSWSDYALTEDSGLTFTKYNATDGKTVLDLEDDAAAANMGGDWHMPTKEQCDELFNTEYVTNAWVENYQDSGMGGSLFTSVSNGNTLFIPAAGNCTNGEIYGGAGVWSSSLYTDNVNNAQDFFSVPFGAKVSHDHRCEGQSVRGVVGNLIYIERINNGVEQNGDIVWDGDSTTISVTLSDAVTADNVLISMSQSEYYGEATATSVDGKTWTATINTKSGWNNFHSDTTVRIWSDSFDYSTVIFPNIMD